MDSGVTAADLALAQSVAAIELTEAEKQDDQVFKRLCFSIEQMICEAKQALDQATKSTGMRVLSLYEVYEKEVAETEESIRDDAEDQDDDDTQSVDQDQEEHGTSNRYSIEATRQYEDSTGQKLQNSNPNGENNRSSLASPLSNSMISTTTMEPPLTMVT
ncbi:hypothetical protein BX616_010444 [Lobosporangium transversale]|nr:hypothetical protein BX616_010444 [Lobosporangium transversale]